ncbi:MAG: amino acid permease [Ignavibacteriota bacterium]
MPSLQAHTLLICLGILALLTLINIRGLRDAGAVFVAPTYIFIASLLIIIVVGIVKVLLTGGHPKPVFAPPHLPAATAIISTWLILKVFASGCTAMTGVEAVSNGVMAFRQPTTKNAQKTLTIIIALLILLLAGIAFLCHAYGVGATNPEGSGYQSVLSQLIGAVMGRGVFYYVSIGSILLVLALSANTAFADFPRLTRAIALNDYLPHVFLIRGRRLLYSHGIYALVFLTCSLLVLFGGVTDRPHPALRDWSIHGVHSLTGRDGGPLVEAPGTPLAGADADQRNWRICYRRNPACGSGRQVCRRRLGHRAC